MFSLNLLPDATANRAGRFPTFLSLAVTILNIVLFFKRLDYQNLTGESKNNKAEYSTLDFIIRGKS